MMTVKEGWNDFDRADQKKFIEFLETYYQNRKQFEEGIRKPVSIEHAAKELRKTHEAYARLTGIHLNAEEVLKQIAKAWGLDYAD